MWKWQIQESASIDMSISPPRMSGLVHINLAAIIHVLASPTRAQASASATTARRRVPDSTISAAIHCKFNDFSNVLFVLELCNAVVFPDMLDQSFYVPADSIDLCVPRTEDARVLPVGTVAVAFDYEAVGDLEDSLVTIFVFAHLPCLAGRKMQCVFAMWTVWFRT
jgi:hypothetical protein